MSAARFTSAIASLPARTAMASIGDQALLRTLPALLLVSLLLITLIE